MTALPNAISQGSNAAGGGALTALVYKSAEKAEPAVIASIAAAKTIFFMSIPIAFNPARFRRPPGTSDNRLKLNSLSGRNLERGTRAVKQKRQAFAAFLGVMTIPENVVRVCCIPTTTLLDFRVGQATFGQHGRLRKDQWPAGQDQFESAVWASPGMPIDWLENPGTPRHEKGRSDGRCGLET